MDRFLKRKNADPVEAEKLSKVDAPLKKQKNSQKFKETYSKEWPCIIASEKEGYAYCTVCRSDFSIVHGGRDDCRRHVTCKRHVEFRENRSSNYSVSSFCTKNEDFDVIRSESFFTRFVIEHNLPISVADHAGPLFAKMFPDSVIAKKYSCGRTKTSSLVRSMAHMSKNEVVDAIRNNSFSLATDGSNDIGAKKIYPIVVTFYNNEKGRIVTTLLSLLESSDNTGEGIFKLIDAELLKLGIGWKNCVAFSCDNASTMTGRYKGVASYIRSKQPNIKVVGCPCHLIHLAAQKATKMLPVDVEMLVIQIYYYLEKSSKRKNILKECQSLCGEKAHKILKHVNTRWLSLESSLNRTVEQWEPLKNFFSCDSEVLEKKNEQFCTIKRLFDMPQTKLYCLFVKTIISTFTKANISLQKEQPCIHNLKEELQKLYFDVLVRFVTPLAISKSESVFSVDFMNLKNQKYDDELVIGSFTRAYLKDANMPAAEVVIFYKSVRKFFCAACDYLKKKLPLQDEFFKHAEVANIRARQSVSYQSVKYFADLFHCYEDSDQLELEFAQYQSDKFSTDITECEQMEVAWHKVSKIKSGDGNMKYTVLPKLMLSVLVVPHSNAPTERVFSMVRKNQTEFRASLGTETLESLLIEKMNMDCCYNKNFTFDELKKAKSACYNELHSSTH